MADGSIGGVGRGAGEVRAQVGEAEWRARVDLAALYRLVALNGWDDAIFTHVSMRVPGPEHHFLINPYGVFFEEMTASSLVKVDLQGDVVLETPYAVNPAGFTIHSAVHAAREDAHCVIHLHTAAGVGVSAQAEGLLPLGQNHTIVIPGLAYHDYEGIALNLDERERLVRDLGDKTLMLLRNHGTMAVGATAAEAWNGIYFLERACAQQVAALSTGRAGVLMAPEASQLTVGLQAQRAMAAAVAELAWPGWLRKLDRHLPGYDQ